MNSRVAAFSKWQKQCAVVGVITLILCLNGVIFSRPQFFESYLFAFLLWFGIAAGCLALLMMYHVVGGEWGDLVRTILEAGCRTLPWFILFFIPVLWGLKTLFPWARPEVAADPIFRHNHLYLNVPFFVVRWILYFAIWTFYAYRLSRISGRPETPEEWGAVSRISAPGLVVYFFTVSLAAVDWMMSLTPHWTSTIYEALVMIGQALGAFAFTILILKLMPNAPSPKEKHTKPLLDLGNLTFAFVILWAYMEVSQYIIIFSGNIPDEISWYLARQQNGWFWMAMVVIFAQFVLPFAALLGRGNKKRLHRLIWIAGLVFVAHIFDTYWLVAPAFHPVYFSLHWLDFATLACVGGFWMALFFGQLKRRPALAGASL